MPPKNEKTFDDYYRKIKSTKINPILEKNQADFEKQIAQFERRQTKIAKFREEPKTLSKDDKFQNMGYMGQTKASEKQRTFNQVTNYENVDIKKDR